MQVEGIHYLPEEVPEVVAPAWPPFGRPRARFEILVTVAYENHCIAAFIIVL